MFYPSPKFFLCDVGFAMDLHDEGALRGVGRL
jgi:hypothetical protein